MRRRAVLVMLLLASALLFAQDGESGGESPRRLMLVVGQELGAGFGEGEIALISRSMLLALRDARPDLVLVEPLRRPAAGSDEESSRLAEESGADCWIRVELSGSRTAPVLRARSFDLFDAAVVIDRTVRRTDGAELSVMNLPGERWVDLAALLAGAYPPRASAGVPARDPGAATLFLRALPGTVVKLSGGAEASATIGPEGTGQIDLAGPVICELRATHPGSSPVRRRIFVQSDRDLALEQKPVARFAIDASLLIAWPGVAFSWSPLPDRLFLRAGVTTYLVGLVLQSDAMFSSDPLTNLDILAGVYVGAIDRPLRVYAGLGGFLRFVHASDWPLSLEPLAPAGLQAVLGLETSIGGVARVFVEHEPMLYATAYPELFRASVGSSGAGWVFFPQAALQLLSFRFGVRWPL